MFNQVTYTQETLCPLALSALRMQVGVIMARFGCQVDALSPLPEIRFLSFEEAVAEARAEGIHWSIEKLRERYDAIEGGYDAKNNQLNFKKGQVISEDLLVHELVHSWQNKEVLIKAGEDISDPFRLDTYFEMEAYMIQRFWDSNRGMESTFKRAELLKRTPYEHMTIMWEGHRKFVESCIAKKVA